MQKTIPNTLLLLKVSTRSSKPSGTKNSFERVSHARSTGIDICDGKKRNASVSKNRITASLKRNLRLQILRKAGGAPATAQACGANKVATWGSSVLGIIDSDLTALRNNSTKAVVQMSKGQSAAATLGALAATGRHKTLDPVIVHHRQVICDWASCVWDGAPELNVLLPTLGRP